MGQSQDIVRDAQSEGFAVLATPILVREDSS